MELCERNSSDDDIEMIANNKTVEWKEHKDFLANGVRDLFLKEFDTDTNVIFNGDVLKGHRLILAIFLPTFKLDVASSDNQLRELKLNSVADRTIEDVRALIEFVYTGKMTVAEGRLDHLSRLAEELSFDGLAKALGECQGQTHGDVKLEPASEAEEEGKGEEGESSDEEEMEDEEEEPEDQEEEAGDGDDSEYRPTTDAEDDSDDGHRAKPKAAVKAKAKDNPTKEEQKALDRYCEHVFQCLRHGYVPQPQMQLPSSKQGPKKTSRKQSQPRRKLGSLVKKEASTDKEEIGALCKCPKCGKEFLNRVLLRRHLKNCSLEQQVVCRFCDHKAVTRNLLRRHLYDAHRREMAAEKRNRVNHIKCPEPLCKFACVDPLRLKLHTQRMHTADKKYKCHECEYATVRQSELTIHVNMCHLKLRNFMCDHCGSRYASQSGLYNHVRRAHQGYKHYKCDHCGKEFSTSECYSVHLQTKHNVGGGVEMHVCDMCGKSYNRRWNLQLHTRRVHKTSLESRVKVHAPRRKEGNGASATLSSSAQEQPSDQIAVPTASTTADDICQGSVLEPQGQGGSVVDCQSEGGSVDERHAGTSTSHQPCHQNEHNFYQAIGSTFMTNATSSWFGGVFDSSTTPRQYQFPNQ